MPLVTKDASPVTPPPPPSPSPLHATLPPSLLTSPPEAPPGGAVFNKTVLQAPAAHCVNWEYAFLFIVLYITRGTTQGDKDEKEEEEWMSQNCRPMWQLTGREWEFTTWEPLVGTPSITAQANICTEGCAWVGGGVEEEGEARRGGKRGGKRASWAQRPFCGRFSLFTLLSEKDKSVPKRLQYPEAPPQIVTPLGGLILCVATRQTLGRASAAAG